MLTLGEVHTGLLQHSTSVAQEACRDLLGLIAGEQVRRSDRPIAYAVSPDLLTGVDCRMPTGSGGRTRGVGTVVSRAAIVGGHVLQGATFTQVAKGKVDRRLPWSHYLAEPGALELVGKADWADLTKGFLAATAAPQHLDLGAVSARLMDCIQVGKGLDRKPPFRMARTKLRWLVEKTADAEPARVHLAVENRTLRTLHLRLGEYDPLAVAEFCEDLAFHDWLLTTLLEMIERSRVAAGHRPAIDRLRPAIDHLLHLWMPGARIDHSLTPLWESLERRPGFTTQWTALVNRIRDQLAVNTVALLLTAKEAGVPA